MGRGNVTEDPFDMDGSVILDVRGTSLEEWLAMMWDPPEGKVFIRNAFPTDGHRDAFLNGLGERPEFEVKAVLRQFLISSGSNPMDTVRADALVEALTRKPAGWQPRSTEHNSRLLKHHMSNGKYPVWEGIGWVLDLLPSHPRKALDVLDAFFQAHYQNMTDNYLSGLFDSMAIIRQRYIVAPAANHALASETTIQSLDWRRFELLCAVLYEQMGYAVTVTPRSGDEGVDVFAERDAPGIRERVVVQVKKYGSRTRIERDNMVHLIGAVDDHKATRGVLVTTGPVRRGALAFRRKDSRVDIIELPELKRLLAEHCGADWASRVDRLIAMMEVAHTKSPRAPKPG